MQVHIRDLAALDRDGDPIDVHTSESAAELPFRACTSSHFVSLQARKAVALSAVGRAHLVAGRIAVLLRTAALPVRTAPPCAIKASHDMRPPTES